MTRNEGTIDRAVRAFVAAPLAVALAFVVGLGSIGGIVLLVVGAVMLATAASGWCPLYTLLRVNTCPRRVRSGA